MAQLTVNVISPGAPLLDALVAATGGGDSFKNSGKETLKFKNAGGGSITVTIKASAGANNSKCNFGVAGTPGHDIALVIPNDSNIYEAGPWPTNPYSDGSGFLQITYSGVSSLSVGAFVAPPSQ